MLVDFCSYSHISHDIHSYKYEYFYILWMCVCMYFKLFLQSTNHHIIVGLSFVFKPIDVRLEVILSSRDNCVRTYVIKRKV